ncbi:MAG: hypothetical protein KDA81_14615, partial [Planctomycetaceae bacterium]|nr:hypothetical protein [Planctomycetaceae bacterium]
DWWKEHVGTHHFWAARCENWVALDTDWLFILASFRSSLGCDGGRAAETAASVGTRAAAEPGLQLIV